MLVVTAKDGECLKKCRHASSKDRSWVILKTSSLFAGLLLRIPSIEQVRSQWLDRCHISAPLLHEAAWEHLLLCPWNPVATTAQAPLTAGNHWTSPGKGFTHQPSSCLFQELQQPEELKAAEGCELAHWFSWHTHSAGGFCSVLPRYTNVSVWLV